MPAERDEDTGRRTVVPSAAGRSLWLAAAWTGVGAAAVCATVAIVVVAFCWLPASGASGHSISAVHAGLLSFLAALHGGVTVDGTAGAFVPLGMTIVVGLTAWRAGSGLADAADALDERDPVRLILAAAAQSASFTVACLVIVPFAALGTSDAPFLGVGLAALLLFTATGGVAVARSSELGPWLTDRLPASWAAVPRLAIAAVTVYIGAGALLVAGSAITHHAEIAALSKQVGGGWSGLPILLLGVLAAPNAAIAGGSYLAGPGFTVGSGTTVSAFGTTHGVVPAFPILGALPTGHGPAPVVWWLLVGTPLLAGLCVSGLAARADAWGARIVATALGAAGAGLLMAVLAGLGGGSVGDGRLRTVGASTWQVGFVVAGEVAVAGAVGLAIVAAWRWLDSGEAPGLAGLLAARDRDDDAARGRDDDAARGRDDDAARGRDDDAARGRDDDDVAPSSARPVVVAGEVPDTAKRPSKVNKLAG
jgi:Family of unknown function (DUF6350)